MLTAAGDPPPDVLSRGINVTHWFRYPPSRDPAALRAYMSDSALDGLKRIGFSFVRLPVQPDLLAVPGALSSAVSRIQRHGLAVVVALFADGWRIEADPAERQRLLATWHTLAPILRQFSRATTFPEILNEPVFVGDAGGWARLQHAALAEIRAAMPAHTIVLTGADWGSISGLLAAPPEPDPRVVYSIHIYEPAELTALGAYRPGLDAKAMARLPFPVTELAACQSIAAGADDAPTADLMRFYCLQHWDVPKVTSRIEEAGAWGRLHHVRVLAGEFGASERLNQSARLAWIRTVRQGSEQAGIGWALWGYDDSMGFAVNPQEGLRDLDPQLLGALGLNH
ncbi:MAG TPA: cellulase family glycosylhydrolase [Acetobacteraceae bacterium]|nr:cellulase family glycosylhydrolase [Acetobacteraceae bacterium]